MAKEIFNLGFAFWDPQLTIDDEDKCKQHKQQKLLFLMYKFH